MRVAVVHSFYSSASPSGENVVVRAQVEHLRAAGHEVALISRSTDDQRPGALHLARSVSAAANGPGPSPDKQLREFRPDVIHVHNLFPNWSTGWLAHWPGRVVTTLHNFRPVCAAATLWRDGDDCRECLEQGTRRALVHRCYRDSVLATLPLAIASRDRGKHQPVLRDSAQIVVLNELAREVYSEFAPGRVNLIPNFVEARPVGSGPRSGWLYVGRLTPEKGVLELLSNFPDSEQLTIIGDGPLAGQIRAVARPNIDFRGPQGPDAVAEAMAGATGLIIPSLWAEGIPTVALEALASGTPLLVSDQCTAASTLTADGAGMIFSPLDGHSVREALARISAAPEVFTANARARHAAAYSPEVWLEQIEGLYARLRGGVAELGQSVQ